MLTNPTHSYQGFDKSHPFLSKVWPIPPLHTEMLTNPTHSRRKFDQSLPFLQKILPIPPITTWMGVVYCGCTVSSLDCAVLCWSFALYSLGVIKMSVCFSTRLIKPIHYYCGVYSLKNNLYDVHHHITWCLYRFHKDQRTFQIECPPVVFTGISI